MLPLIARLRAPVPGEGRSFRWSVAETFVTRLFGIAIGVLTLTLTTHLLGPEGRGQFALTMAALATVLQFGNAGLHVSATYWLARDAGRRRAVGGLLAWFSCGPVALLCAAAVLIVWRWPGLLSNVPMSHIVLAMLAGPPSMFLMLSGNAYLGLGRPSIFNAIDLSGKLAGAAAVLLLLWGDLRVVFAAYALLHFALAMAVYRLLIERWRPPPGDWIVARELLTFGGRAFLLNVSMFLVLRIDLFMLNAMSGTSEAGIYSVAVQIGDILTLTTSSVTAMLFPKLAAMDPDRRWPSSLRVVRHSGVLLAIMAIGIAAVARPLFAIWFGPAFAGSVVAIWWLLPGLWCLGINGLLQQHLATYGLPLFLLVSTLLAALANIALNLIAIPRYGIAGAAVASSLTYLLLLGSTAVYLHSDAARAFRGGGSNA